jgi:hypothetical protein
LRQRAEIERALGADPLVYVSRFQVVEDRGEGPALFGVDPAVDTEYVVIASVFVDRDRIRERLARAGIAVAPVGAGPQIRSRLILEGVDAYDAYAEIRRALLEDLKLRAAIPRELAPGRAVLEISSDREPSELLGALQSAVAERLELVPIRVEAGELALRVERRAAAPAAEPSRQPFEGLAPIDTPNPNRY